MDRITVIRKSLTAFVCGIFGLVPFLGFVPATFALLTRSHVRARYRGEWNPAATYLNLGAGLALLGLFISVVALAIPVVIYIYNF